ncbi:hypothetical protein F5B22DRAFT_634718 [Xylaria bambusicola]|uniref:uncharacterized protein n=1 Tax=Xylaria bambusicola TaxID=326684 RepID=UPI002007ED43|nr:uncharacterized protein F5B22DRAFT_634718 [Xylaria bambusicola]KAI0521335.1 hypothetical protein F5B22DRAFT_634718 [Xylaria bambusicola]
MEHLEICDPIYFWRPQEVATGYLSQWYSQPFRDRTDNSKIYATAEHYMMHHKALLFDDEEIASAILEASSPRDVKELGRAVRGFDDAVWERERSRIVAEGNWCKFTLPVLDDAQTVQNKREEGKEEEEGGRVWKLGNTDAAETMQAPSFRDVLLATGTRELVEASPYDRIWGVGFAAKGAERNRSKWGLNLLGKCLMEVREQFRREAEEKAQGEDGKER